MRSKFQAFFVIMKLLLAVVTLAFIGTPVSLVIYSVFHPEALLPAILATGVFGTFVYLLIKDHKVITIELSDTSLRLNSVLSAQSMLYGYSDIERISIEVYREESYSKYGKLVSVNYDPMATIYFKDGNEFTMYDDTYSNVEEMIAFIESKRSSR